MKRITIFHYHLEPGGVSSVIAGGAEALLRYHADLETLHMVSATPEEAVPFLEDLKKVRDQFSPHVELAYSCLPEVGYWKGGESPEEALRGIGEYKKSLRERFGGSLWWIHNYHLGKNPLFTRAVLEIAEERGQPLLLHIHDFPECARYENLRLLKRFGMDDFYPVTENVIYAVINYRDRRLLREAGIPAERIHLLVNPVTVPAEPRGDKAEARKRLADGAGRRYPGYRPDKQTLLYPVRAIRRKNVLEAGLLTKLCSTPSQLLVTLPGLSDTESPYSRLVDSLFKEGVIPGVLATSLPEGGGLSYRQALDAADLVLSSSVQEGFGYLFFESAFRGLPLAARELDVLQGFRESLPPATTRFYGTVLVPQTAAEREGLWDRYHTKLLGLDGYLPDSVLEGLAERFRTRLQAPLVDFSYLPVESQAQVLQRGEDTGYRRELQSLNGPLLSELSALGGTAAAGAPAHLSEILSLNAYADSFAGIRTAFTDPPPPPAPGAPAGSPGSVTERLREVFASPAYLRLLYDF